MKRKQAQVFTVPQIAARLGKPRSFIESALKKEGIKPIMRIGNARLFDEIGVEKISLSLTMKQSTR
jgi:hypothetical protein